MLTVSQLASACGATLQLGKGDSESKPIDTVATIQDAQPNTLTFLTNNRYTKYLQETNAGAVILAPENATACPTTCLVSTNPHASYALAASALHPLAAVNAGIHPSAVVDPGATVSAEAEIAAGAVIGAAASVAAGCVIGPNCVIGENVSIGEDSRLHGNVVVMANTQIGSRVRLHAGVVIGSDGFGFARTDAGPWQRVPQVGRVIIADDVDIGANSAIDCGAIGDTIIGTGVKIDNQCQIAHNVQIGEHTLMSGGVLIAGSAVIGKNCMFGGGVGIAGHLHVPDGTVLTARTTVFNSIDKAGVYSSGSYAEPAKQWRRNVARARHLDELAKRVRQLEKQIAQLEASNPSEDDAN